MQQSKMSSATYNATEQLAGLIPVCLICKRSYSSISPPILPFAAMKPQEVQEKLGLFRMRDRNWYVQPACATTGDGLYEGLTWLTSNHKS